MEFQEYQNKLEKIYLESLEHLLYFSFTFTQDKQEREDVIHDVFCRYLNQKKFECYSEYNTKQLKNSIYISVKRAFLDLDRKTKNRNTSNVDQQTLESLPDFLDNGYDMELVRKKFSDKEVDYDIVIEANVNLTLAAERMGITRDALYKKLERIKKDFSSKPKH